MFMAMNNYLRIITQIHGFTSIILFEQRRFGLGCPSLCQVKWQEKNLLILSFGLSSLLAFPLCNLVL